MSGPALSDRTRRILATLVRSYIETGEPVASATLAHKAGLEPLVRHRSQRPGAARRDGLRVAAAHLGRPRADRRRLSLLRRHAARGAPLDQGRVGGRSAPAAGSRRRAADGRPAVVDLARAVRSRQGVGFAIAPPNAAGALSTHRVRAAQRQPHPRRRGRERQPGVAEDRGHRRSGEHVGAGAGRQLPQLGILRTHAGRGARRRHRAAQARSARCTISCWDWRCGSPAARFENLDRPTSVYIDGASTLLEEVVQASGISTVDAAGVVADGGRKAAPGRAC